MPTEPREALEAEAREVAQHIRDVADEMARENPKRLSFKEVMPHTSHMKSWAALIDRLACHPEAEDAVCAVLTKFNLPDLEGRLRDDSGLSKERAVACRKIFDKYGESVASQIADDLDEAAHLVRALSAAAPGKEG